jgi:streptogramin lyase
MLAAAMLETEKMDPLSYPVGDGKTGDSFAVGTTKQNWLMLRQCHPAWQTLRPEDYQIASTINQDRRLEVEVFDECRAYFGELWWAGHRNGQSGLDNPNTQDVAAYKTVMDWTDSLLPGHLCDDVRFWIGVVGP